MSTYRPGILERIGLLIWKMKYYDQIVAQLEAELEAVEEEIARLKYRIEKLEGKQHD